MKENNNKNDVKIKKVTEYKGFKVAVGILVAIFVCLIATFVAIGIFNSVVNNVSELKANKMMTSVMLKFMPEKIQTPDGEYTFYVEKNKNFDPENDDLSKVVNFYHLDQNNNKFYIEDGVYVTETGENMNVTLGFMAQTLMEINSAKSKIIGVAVVLAVIVAALIIWISYYIYSYNEDKKKTVNKVNIIDKNSKNNK